MSGQKVRIHTEEHESRMNDLERGTAQASKIFNIVKNDIVVHYETPPSAVHVAMIHHKIDSQ